MILHTQLNQVSANPWQTRKVGGMEYIKELAMDIAANGLLQAPVGRLIDEHGKPAGFDINDMDPKLWGKDDPGRWRVQLAFGHNRLEAYRWLNDSAPSSNISGDWGAMPVEVRRLSDEQMAVLAWSENEKRRDHTPIERALAIAARIDDFHWTHEHTGEMLGISRSTVSNTLRLLKLPEHIQTRLQDGTISERQAASLIPLYEVDEQQSSESDFIYSRQAIEGWALEGYSSEMIRKRVSEAIDYLNKQIQPELDVDFESRSSQSWTWISRADRNRSQRRKNPEMQGRGRAPPRPSGEAVSTSFPARFRITLC